MNLVNGQHEGNRMKEERTKRQRQRQKRKRYRGMITTDQPEKKKKDKGITKEKNVLERYMDRWRDK